ncbi:MAG: single-stranded-DNA-specific exonuclease RecJ [bacterium]|nr:single-stranded-DNA-specific exonuclease RecJ [bacterium]
MQEIKSTKAKKHEPRQWQLADDAPASHLKRFGAYPRVVAQLLLNRGITDPAEAAAFLEPDYASGLEDPAQLKDLAEAAEIIRGAIAEREPIVVHGDYDADGLTATALLADAIKRLGGTVDTFIPDRYQDGYGVTTDTLKKLKQDGAAVVVTVDCGISCAKEIAAGRKDGLRIVVTDHHEPPPRIPDTEAVVNPKRPGDGYPNKELTGVGVAFKLAQALIKASGLGAREQESAEKWLLDLVAIGTVADLADLRGENRTLVHFGLTVLRKSPRPGLQALLTAAGVEQENVTAGTLGYTIAPRLNAAGRLGRADDALSLLMAKDPAEAKRLADTLEDRNRERRELTESAVAEARERLGRVGDDRAIIIVEGPWKSGIAGLIAGRLSQTYARPALVLGQEGDTYTGSARSTAGFHITDALRANEALLEKFGGHAQAAGLTVSADKLANFKRSLEEFAGKRLGPDDYAISKDVDMEVRPEEVTEELCRYLDRFEPHGRGNPRPSLLLKGVTVEQVSTVGEDGKHLKKTLRLPDGRSIPAIAFGEGERAAEAAVGSTLDIIGRPMINQWNGRTSLEWRLDDFRGA